MKKKTIIWIAVLAALAIAIIGLGAKQYYHYGVSNFTSYDNESHSYYITTDMSTDSILSAILRDYKMDSHLAWELTCQHTKFNKPKPGYYKMPAEISSRELVRRLQWGEQTPYKVLEKEWY